MQAARLLHELRQLSVNDRLELLNLLWSEINESESIAPLTPEQRKVLDERLAQHLSDPNQAVPWEQARNQVLDQL